MEIKFLRPELETLHKAGIGNRELARLTAPVDSYVLNLAISPDGVGMIVSASPGEGQKDLIVWSRSGMGGQLEAASRPCGVSPGTWSPGGGEIALTYVDGDASRIAVHKLLVGNQFSVPLGGGATGPCPHVHRPATSRGRRDPFPLPVGVTCQNGQRCEATGPPPYVSDRCPIRPGVPSQRIR